MIKSVNYGKNILILYNLIQENNNRVTFNRASTSESDENYVMLIDGTTGIKILPET